MTVAELLAELDGIPGEVEVTAAILGPETVVLRAGGDLLGYLDA